MDIVSSGGTLFNNGLVEREVVLRSETVLVSRKDLDTELNQLLQTLIFRVNLFWKQENSNTFCSMHPLENLEQVF